MEMTAGQISGLGSSYMPPGAAFPPLDGAAPAASAAAPPVAPTAPMPDKGKGAKGKGKGKGKGQDDDKVLLLKMVLNNSLKTRELRGCVMTIYHIPSSSELAKALQQAGVAYNKVMQELSHDLEKKKAHGRPHTHKWAAMIVAARKDAMQIATQSSEQGVVNQMTSAADVLKAYYSSRMEGGAPREVHQKLEQTVLHLKTKLDYTRKFLMTELYVSPDSEEGKLLTTISVIIYQLKGTMKYGAAPPGEMERQAQSRLEALLSEMEE